MGTTDSRGRVRLTHATYLLALVAIAASGGRAIDGGLVLAAQSAGFLLVVAAVLGRLWTSLFIAGRKGAELVVDGPYSMSRHPLYLCTIAAALGIGLTSRSVVLSVALPLAIGLPALLAARREDRALAAAHDAAWRGYRDAVPAFWPSPSLGRTPESVSVRPDIFRKAFLDAASLLGLWLLVVLIETLRASGGWPNVFLLP